MGCEGAVGEYVVEVEAEAGEGHVLRGVGREGVGVVGAEPDCLFDM